MTAFFEREDLQLSLFYVERVALNSTSLLEFPTAFLHFIIFSSHMRCDARVPASSTVTSMLSLILHLLGNYRGAEKSLARPGRKQARMHVRDGRDFNNIETRAVSKFFFLQGKAPKEIHAILTGTLACFLPGRAKDLSAPLYC